MIMKFSFKNIVRGVLFTSLCGLSLSAYSQSRNPLTQFNRLPYLYNPAATGAENLTEITMGTRQQWVSGDDTPKSYFLGASHSFQKEEAARTKVGIAGFVVREDLGLTAETQLGISSAVHVPLSEKYFLSVGFKVNHGREALNEFRVRDPFAQEVINLRASGGAVSYLDIAPGLMLHSRKFYVGYSALQMVRTQFEEMLDSNEKVPVIQSAMIGYVYQLNDDFEISPGALVQMVGNIDPTVMALAKLRYQSKFWAGAGFSPNRAVSALVGFAPSTHLNISYSFDSSLGGAGSSNFGSSHELILGFPLFNSNPASLLWK